MAAIILILTFVLVISLYSEIHALGLWVFMMITHGFVVEVLGPAAAHLPMYAGIMIMAITVARRKWTGMRANLLLLMSCLLALMALAALFGMEPVDSLERLILYSKGFVVAALIAGVMKDDSQIEIVTLYIVAAAFTGACIAFGQHFTGTYTIDSYSIQRAGGLAEDPNDTAMLLLAGLPFAAYWSAHSIKPHIKLLFFSVFVLIIGAIVLTQSRGGGLALLLILLLFYLRRPSIKVTVIGISALTVGFLMTSAAYLERMQSVTTVGASKDGSLDIRFQLVETGIDVLLANPVLGVGIGNFGKAFAQSNSNFAISDFAAHNMYLEFFVENGVIAGLLFLTLMAVAVLRSLKYDTLNNRESSIYGLGFCVSMSILSVMINGLFLSQGKSAVLWFLIGIGLAFSELSHSARTAVYSRL
jgi:O-antigen ligase